MVNLIFTNFTAEIRIDGEFYEHKNNQFYKVTFVKIKWWHDEVDIYLTRDNINTLTFIQSSFLKLHKDLIVLEITYYVDVDISETIKTIANNIFDMFPADVVFES